MKSRFALLAMMALAAAPLAAQGGGQRQGGGRGQTIESLTELYTLTPDQAKKVEPILKAYNDARMPLMQYMQAVRQEQGTPSPDSTKKQQDLMAKFNTDFKAVLTADQSKKWDSVQAARAQGGGRRGGGF